MKLGIDLGYNAVKIKTRKTVTAFPSVVGTPERASFSFNGHTDMIIHTDDGQWLIGESAVAQSRFASRREDRNWIHSPEYYRLMLAALTEASSGSSTEFAVVTGLPVSFYKDKGQLQELFLGQHRVKRNDRNWQSFTVTDCRVIPQPFGAVLAVALDTNGRVINSDIAQGNIGVIDVGGKTTNLLSVSRLSEISKETASISLGAWDIVRQIRQHLAAEFPDLDLRDHELSQVIIQRWFTYFGDTIGIGEVIDDILMPMAEQVVAEASQLWNSGARLNKILVAGGGANLLGQYILDHFQHAYIVDNPTFANVEGFYRFSQRF